MEKHVTNPVIDPPCEALCALHALEDAGFDAWFVGGFIRDSLLKRPSSDIDIATSALYTQAEEVFESCGYRVRETGAAHGTITVLIGKKAFEVTTFRTEGTYSDARHPDTVTPASTVEEDLSRRDFTINALAYNPKKGLYDPFGGQADILAKTICAVGNPEKRFEEDALRILRACRFSSQLGFSIEPQTYAAMLKNKRLLPMLSAERISQELDLLLLGDHVHDALITTADVLGVVLPEIVSCRGFAQLMPAHIYDVWEHTAYVVESMPKSLLGRWAALAHDLGKPACSYFDDAGVGHFFGHPVLGASIAEGLLRRLKKSPRFIAKVILLVLHHDEHIHPNHKEVKKVLFRFEGDVSLFRTLCDLKRSDALSHSPQFAHQMITSADALEATLDEILSNNEAFMISDLAINGTDLINAGIPEGNDIGTCLKELLSCVINEEVENTPEELLRYVSKRLKADSCRFTAG